MKKITTPITYYGGKQRMLKHILPIIPKHNLYCEPFVGGGALFWAKSPSKVEVINDLNGEVVNFYRVAQQDWGILRMLILSTPHSRQVHREAEMVLKNPDCYSTVKRAWALWVQTNMSYSSSIFGGFAYERKTNHTSLKIYNKKCKLVKALRDRLNLVQIENNNALKVITSRDAEDSFFYLDPPYYNSDCGHYKGYSQDDFENLLKTAAAIKGKFLLSSYPSELLSNYVTQHGWFTKKIQSQIAVTHKTNKVKTEVLTANYPI